MEMQTLWSLFLGQGFPNDAYPGLQLMYDESLLAITAEDGYAARQSDLCAFVDLYTRLKTICERANVVSCLDQSHVSIYTFKDAVNGRVHVATVDAYNTLCFKFNAFETAEAAVKTLQEGNFNTHLLEYDDDCRCMRDLECHVDNEWRGI